MADFISPWMPEHSGARLVDMDILKGQQAMAELAQVPSKIRMQQAHSALYEAQAARQLEQIQKDKDIREAMSKMSEVAGGGGDPMSNLMSDEWGPGDVQQAARNPLWRMSEVLRVADPKLSGELANKASMIDAREIRSQKDMLRAAQIAVQTQSERFDQLGRRMQGVQTMDDLLREARIYERVTGMKTGLFGPNGEDPNLSFSSPEARDSAARKFAGQLADSTMKRKDAMLAAERQARDTMMGQEYESRQRQRDWQRDDDAQRRSAEAKRRPASEKAGEKPLTSTERKEGADYIKAEQPNAGDRLNSLGDELMERAKRLRAQQGGTLADAKKEILDRMRKEGKFTGIPGSGRSMTSPKDFPTKDGKPDAKAAEANTWYRNGNQIFFYDGKRTYSPQEMRQRSQTSPQSAAALATLASANETDDDNEDVNADTLNDDEED